MSTTDTEESSIHVSISSQLLVSISRSNGCRGNKNQNRNDKIVLLVLYGGTCSRTTRLDAKFTFETWGEKNFDTFANFNCTYRMAFSGAISLTLTGAYVQSRFIVGFDLNCRSCYLNGIYYVLLFYNGNIIIVHRLHQGQYCRHKNSQQGVN